VRYSQERKSYALLGSGSVRVIVTMFHFIMPPPRSWDTARDTRRVCEHPDAERYRRSPALPMPQQHYEFASSMFTSYVGLPAAPRNRRRNSTKAYTGFPLEAGSASAYRNSFAWAYASDQTTRF
jgi:hypothetical protein